jgi:hypothetical protein
MSSDRQRATPEAAWLTTGLRRIAAALEAYLASE